MESWEAHPSDEDDGEQPGDEEEQGDQHVTPLASRPPQFQGPRRCWSSRTARTRHGIPWGPFWLAQVYKGGKSSGTCLGWSCIRGQHSNHNHDRKCQKQCQYRGGTHKPVLSDEESFHRIKAWLLVGFRLPQGSQQSDHLRIQPRDIDLSDFSEEELAATVLSLPVPDIPPQGQRPPG